MNTLIFIPNGFSTEKSGFIEGFYKDHSYFEVYYITKTRVFSVCKNHIGYVGKIINGDFLGKKTIFVERGTKNIQVNHDSEIARSVTEVYYDIEEFKMNNLSYCKDGDSGVVLNDLSEKLADSLHKTNGNKHWLYHWWLILIFSKLRSVIKNCAILTHIESNIKTTSWFLSSLEQGKYTPTHSNICFAKLIDLTLGLIFFYLGQKFKCDIISQFHFVSQDFVTHLRKLLIYLMGSPIGLKLNYAFNHSLGKFFFYHINLWRVFLQAMQPLLEANFTILLLPALLGLSYQIAVICDIISLATFHTYCIYVYAARLYSLQIKGLTTLSRLFIGRKYNPLRNRVDSCNYSSTQLFIGTLGFTILLFLLPTTLMYYTVFVAFRLATLGVYTVFNKLKNWVSNIPLYIFVMWVLRSSSIAGTPHLSWIAGVSKNAQITVKLAPLSLGESLHRFSHTVKCCEGSLSFGTIVTHVFSGQRM
ncbi:phosphatidylinositol N-acetylglucosaminyltransferase subunit Q isoform X2 [Euwallacea fornicatus]|uniref:phosphatidylinositol N-acetylglucosaminyltransferase subunit Q isoform X2 n=1 Tax=Euwallacea fornicatus TaxID=995702 RepID=UPI00338DD18F